jgi:hypothetical protein
MAYDAQPKACSDNRHHCVAGLLLLRTSLCTDAVGEMQGGMALTARGAECGPSGTLETLIWGGVGDVMSQPYHIRHPGEVGTGHH